VCNGCSAETVPDDAVRVKAGTARTLLDIVTDGETKSSSGNTWRFVESLDIFTFETGDGMHLDSYERKVNPGYMGIEVFSGQGERIIVMVANTDLREFAKSDVFCYEDLQKLVVNYCDDSADYPIMTGECRTMAGTSKNTLILRPILALIELHSITSTPDLKDVCIYLVNAGGSARPFLKDSVQVNPVEFINQGKLCEDDLRKMVYPRMAYHYIGNGKRTGGKTTFGSGSLYCYPNNSSGETAGSPFTKVVVEGCLGKNTVTYEIDVNQTGCGYSSGLHGIVRNRRYFFDLVIN